MLYYRCNNSWQAQKEVITDDYDNDRFPQPVHRGTAYSFFDPNAIIFDDDEHSQDEDRFILIGVNKYDKLLTVCHCYKEQNVLIDRDVAELYGVETKRINEAVANNRDKFPDGYVISLDDEEWNSLRSKISTLNEQGGRGQHTKYKPQAFTEKGLYMLATILKSQRATETTIAIVETFSKIRELSRVISQLPVIQDKSQQKSLMQRSGEILAEVLDDNALEVSSDETTIEINLAVMKIKHTIRRDKRNK